MLSCLSRAFLALCLLNVLDTVSSQSVTANTAATPTTLDGNVILSGTNAITTEASFLGGDGIPTGSNAVYQTYSTTSLVDGSIQSFGTRYVSSNGSATSGTSASSTTSSISVSILRGASPSTTGNSSMTVNSTSTSTSTSAAPTNTQPCNNHPEFCDRSYSNITFVAAHNSPFVKANNFAANQVLPVLDQLNDGVRMLQGQTHYNATTKVISYCHTSCDLLDAGTAEAYFTTVAGWVRTHPYDVVTILIGNEDYVHVENYTSPLENSGLTQFAYIPPQVPMNISSWPTLGELILSQKRVIIFMDYNANQTAVPYILDEFAAMSETPFSPTDSAFPCTIQRPPDRSDADVRQRMYMANHNLNTHISVMGESLLVPTTTLINQTNAVSGNISLGLMTDKCIDMWSRPPNFLLVDYYNYGNVPGSVFQVAAQHNNVSYTRPCCGLVTSSSQSLAVSRLGLLISIMLAVAAAL